MITISYSQSWYLCAPNGSHNYQLAKGQAPVEPQIKDTEQHNFRRPKND